MGGQYVDIGDGEWTYDVAKNEWSGGKGVSPLTCTYRTGKFHPDYFLQGPRPDRAAHQKVLDAMPVNQWVLLQPPHLPEMNRDWGTAVLDPDRDLILRWSGGHCAHSGSDVLHYHIATNRWELPFPVEFPLGQCYTNTEFPEGVNFNGRPWVTGHTYQNYGYDPVLKKMLFTGRDRGCFVWDCDLADWSGRIEKPKGMSYGSCFYTLTLTPTPQGLVCWTNEGRLFQFEAKTNEWIERKLSGEKLPGSVVDNSTIAYDSKRNRLLSVVKSYGDKVTFSGDLHAIDCDTWNVTKLSPGGREAAAEVPYLCQLRYDEVNDLLLVGGTLPPDDTGLRRTPAYDCAGNRWISLKITGDDPSPKGRNVSLGMMYHAKRKLFLAVDTKSHVFALKLDLASADPRVVIEAISIDNAENIMNPPDPTPILVTLFVLLPLALTGMVLGSIAIFTYHRRALYCRKAGAELILEMLRREMTADEIERILLAWNRDEGFARKLLAAKTPPPKKFVG